MVADIAVIVLAYNRPRLLTEALSSVARQTRTPDELVIVDDCSPEPLEIAASIATAGARIVRQPTNQGPASAARRGLEETEAELVAFLNDDDLWNPDFLERLSHALEAHPEAAVAFCDHDVVDVDGTLDHAYADRMSMLFKRDRLRDGLVDDLPRVALLDKSIPGASFAVTRRAAIDASLIAAGGDVWDYFLCLSICRSGRPGVFVSERLGAYRISPSGITATGAGDPQQRLRTVTKQIAASRLVLKCPSLSAIWRDQSIVLLRLSLTAAVLALRTRSVNGTFRGVAQIVYALWNLLSVGGPLAQRA